MPNVLIADDSIAVRKVAERLLTEAGFGVTLAANGEEALAYLSKETPDLVVSDVIMPDKSGYEVCAFVRARIGLANTPVLLISGIVNDEVTKQAESCHADGVLKKPFQGTSLKDRVLELLAKRQGAATPAAKTIDKTIEAIESIQRLRMSEGEDYQQAVPRLSPLEGEPRVDRDRTMLGAQRFMPLEGPSSRVKELESMVAWEREQAAQLKNKLAEADSVATRVKDLESLLKVERERTVEAKNQASAADSLGRRVWELEAALQKEREANVQQATRLAEQQMNASRIQELEANLYAERQAAMQLAQQVTEMEVAVAHSRELSEALVQERERTSDLTRRAAEHERVAARVDMLEQALSAEQEKNRDLGGRLHEVERALHKAQEFESLLLAERERNAILARRISDAEQASGLATKRFEEVATKLGEIAGWASQLGNGKR
ncbi:MAG: response regulator [Nitrospiraceae bacterium]|nr:response regulator [Nitrospiraceae bacterium]